jgi:hypothetical protein
MDVKLKGCVALRLTMKEANALARALQATQTGHAVYGDDLTTLQETRTALEAFLRGATVIK